jgi:hypothetical protein
VSGFGLLEYSLGNVIRARIVQADRAAKEKPEDIEHYQSDMLRSVFVLYVTEDPGRKRPDYLEQSPVQLPNQRGEGAPAMALCLGSWIRAAGEITQALYAPWAVEKLLDANRLPALTEDAEKPREFLLWIGVSRWPRQIVDDKPDGRYLEYMFKSIVFPASFEDKWY